MLLLENRKPGFPMYPYSSPVPSNSSVVVAPDSDASTAMLLSGQPQSPNSMFYAPPALTLGLSQQKSRYVSNNGSNGAAISAASSSSANATSNGAVSDIMSHSMLQSSNSQHANSNTGSFYCWPMTPSADSPASTVIAPRMPHSIHRRNGDTGYKISPQNPLPDFSHVQYNSRQQQPTVHRTTNENGGYSCSSGKLTGCGTVAASTGGNNSNNNWKERPHVGKYSLIRTIGKGNFAKVKLAQHVTTGMEVAVKVIDKTQLNPTSLRKLFREVRILKTLHHPNIIKLLEVIESEKHLYLVMEYASNGEVFDYLVTHGKMKEKDARLKFRQLVSAVQYCHAKNIVHRDLKAENLLLDDLMSLKIADFGFSNNYSAGRKLDTFCGSPPYAAPELFLGLKYDGPEVDVWSLGVILYTLVSGSLPFDGKNLKELRECVLRGSYRVPFYMSHECEVLLRKMLVLNPAKRASLLEIMKNKWLNTTFEDNTLQPFKEDPPNYNDPERIELMVQMGFSRSDIYDSLRKQRFNNITATYILFGQRKQKALPWPATLSSAIHLRSFSSEMSATNAIASASAMVANSQQPTSYTRQLTSTTTSTAATTAASFRRPFRTFNPTAEANIYKYSNTHINSNCLSAGQGKTDISIAGEGGGGRGKVISSATVEGEDAGLEEVPLAKTDKSDVNSVSSSSNAVITTTAIANTGTLKRQKIRTESQQSIVNNSTSPVPSLPSVESYSASNAHKNQFTTLSITSRETVDSVLDNVFDSRNDHTNSHLSTLLPQTPSRGIPAISERPYYTRKNIFTSSEGDPNSPILAPRASDATVAGVDTSLSRRVLRRNEATSNASNSMTTPNRPQVYELINPAVLEPSLQKAPNVAGFSSRRINDTNISQYSLGYRSLRLPADVAVELRPAAGSASGTMGEEHSSVHFNNSGTSYSSYPLQGSGAIGASNRVAKKSASPTEEVAVAVGNENRPFPGGGRGFSLPFSRNVPGRSTIQHVPASQTRDRLVLEQPDKWFRPLVRHPGTAAHMDQKTTLADLHNQGSKQLETAGYHSPSDLSAMSVASNSVTSKGPGTSDSINEFETEEEGDDEDDNDLDVDDDVDEECSIASASTKVRHWHPASGVTRTDFSRSRFSDNSTPAGLQATAAVIQARASTFSKTESRKVSTNSGNGSSRSGGFLRNLSMRISRSKLFKLPFGNGGGIVPSAQQDSKPSDSSILRDLPGTSQSESVQTPLATSKLSSHRLTTGGSGGIARSRSTVSSGRSNSRSKSPSCVFSLLDRQQHVSRRSAFIPETSTTTDRSSRDTTPTNNDAYARSPSNVLTPRNSLVEHFVQSGSSSVDTDIRGNTKVLFRTESNTRRQLDEMMVEIKHALLVSGVAFSQTDHPHRLHCIWVVNGSTPETDLDSGLPVTDAIGSGEVLRLELEVCKLPKEGMNGVRFRRLAGPAAEFKRISQKLAEDLKL